MGFFSNIFGKQRSASSAADPFLRQLDEMARNNYNPHVQRGERAAQSLEPLFKRFSEDPTGYLNELQQGYKPSTGYNFKRNELEEQARNAAAAGGFSGTPYHQQQQTRLVEGLLNDDMQQWLQNIMGIQSTGLTGQQGFANTGYNATESLTDILGSNLNQRAQMAYRDQEEKNARRMARFNKLLELGGTAAKAFGSPESLAADAAFKGAENIRPQSNPSYTGGNGFNYNDYIRQNFGKNNWAWGQ